MNAIDYFAGLGGTCEGATRAGVRVRVSLNHWPVAVEWHQKNHPDVEHVCQDLLEADHTTLAEFAGGMLLASPSCKGLSEAGQPARKGTGGSHAPDAVKIQRLHQRHRNTAWAVVSAAESWRPSVIAVENVPRMMRWELFDCWRGCLDELGYNTRVQIVNGLHYGSAQHRPRMILTGALSGPVDLAPTFRAPRSIGDCLTDGPHRWSTIESKSERMRWRMRKAQNEAGAACFWNNVSESRGRTFGEPFPTATQKSGGQWYILDGERCRLITARELARSMSFPDSYVLPRSKDVAGQLIGNAIDCSLAEGIALQLKGAA